MKYTTLFTIALASLGLTNAALAVDVYITGSSAYRAPTYDAIVASYDSPPTIVAQSDATLGKAKFAHISGTITISGAPTQIDFYSAWSGSEAGIRDVARPNLIAFLPSSASGVVAESAATDNQNPDIAMSDTFQGTSQFKGVFGGVTYASLTEAANSPVGIVPFKWVARNGTPITGVTTQQVRALFAAGKLPLALFTGLTADETKPVIATGRDPFSGTRLTAFAEGGLGALAIVRQYQPQDSTGALVKATNATISKYVPWPAGGGVALFNGGFSSGGDLTKAMAANSTNPVTVGATPFDPANLSVISYSGTDDADGNLLGNATRPGVELTWNGVLLGNTGGDYNTATVLTEGRYSFWGFEHMLYNNATISAQKKAVADRAATLLNSTYAVVKLSSMKVTRTTDGAPVTNNYATP